MIGLGVGIDYALFIVTRYREGLHAGTVAAGRDPRRHGLGGPGRGLRRHDRRDLDARPPARRHRMGRRRGRRRCRQRCSPPCSPRRPSCPALLGLAQARVEVTRWRGLLAAGFGAVALLGAGLGFAPLAAVGAVLAVLTLVASLAVRPLRRPVPRRSPAARTADLALSLEPHDPAAPVAVAGRRVRRAARPRLPGDEHAPRVARRGQLPRGHLHAAGLRPDGRGLRGGVQRTVPDHRRARPRVPGPSGRRATRPARWRTCSGRWPGPRAWPR